MKITSFLYGAIFGSIVGLIWALALNASITEGLMYGSIVGGIFGLILSKIGESAAAKGNVSSQESAFVSGSLLTIYSIIISVIGLLVWIVRIIFW